MKKQLKCNRCLKAFEEYTEDMYLYDVRDLMDNGLSTHSVHQDLCPDCMHSLEKWLRMKITDNKVVHLEPDKERLVLQFNCVMSQDVRHKLQQKIHEQYKTGVVVLPPMCAALIVKNESFVDLRFPLVEEEDDDVT